MSAGRSGSFASSDNSLNLDLAIETMHRLGLEDGDVGFAYWYEVAQLLKAAGSMRIRIAELESEAASLKSLAAQADVHSSGNSDTRSISDLLSSSENECPYLFHNLLKNAQKERSSRAGAASRPTPLQAREWLADDFLTLLPASEKDEADGEQVSDTSPEDADEFQSALELGAKAVLSAIPPNVAGLEGSMLPLTAEFVVTNLSGPPTEIQERYRIELDLPLTSSNQGVALCVVDDTRGEYITTRLPYQAGATKAVSLILASLATFKFGTVSLPKPQPYPLPFNRAHLSIAFRHALAPNVTLAAICASATEGGWTIDLWSQRSADSTRTINWRSEVPLIDPYHVMWTAARELGFEPMS